MNGFPFFRKVFWYPEKTDETDMSQLSYNERAIIKILMKNPHPNIVSFYHVNKKYVDMELLDTENINIEKAKKTMKKVKTFLQGLGIWTGNQITLEKINMAIINSLILTRRGWLTQKDGKLNRLSCLRFARQNI